MLFSKKMKSYYNTESGRSMIEMLGVLAIVGVLSIAGIAGYEFAVLKFRTNEIINELNGRAISVSSLLLNSDSDYAPEEVIEDGFGDTLSIGYGVESVLSDRNSNYFEISVMDVPDKVCVQLVKSYENPIMIFADDVSYNNDTSICQNESGVVDMDFIYRNDLGEHDKCSAKGYFGEEDFKCHCSGSTYIDPNNPRECLCPGGHVWDSSAGEHGDCIESLCPEGYFESQSNGCVPCDDTETYSIANDDRHKALCTASSCGRIVVLTSSVSSGVLCVNANVHHCTPGTSFRIYNGSCRDCPVDGGIYGVPSAYQDLCKDCPGYTWSSGYCFPENMCNKGTEFLYPNSSYGSMQCRSCSDPEDYNTQRGDLENEYCRACKNDEGVANRTVIDNTCRKTTCDSDEFKGANGRCYKCTHQTKIAVNAGSGCTNVGCGRTEVVGDDGKKYCQISNCPTDGTHTNVNGSCYACSGTTPFKSTKSQCDVCLSRMWLGTEDATGTATGFCMVQCKKNQQFPDGEGRYCIPCAGLNGRGVGYVGDSVVGAEYCAACGGYVSARFCVLMSKCADGMEFRVPGNWSYDVCRSCDLVDAVTIGTHESDREKCLKCDTTKRFWNQVSCYRCDTIETPDITTEEERDSCLSCAGIRTVSSDNKCVLIQ